MSRSIRNPTTHKYGETNRQCTNEEDGEDRGRATQFRRSLIWTPYWFWIVICKIVPEEGSFRLPESWPWGYLTRLNWGCGELAGDTCFQERIKTRDGPVWNDEEQWDRSSDNRLPKTRSPMTVSPNLHIPLSFFSCYHKCCPPFWYSIKDKSKKPPRA